MTSNAKENILKEEKEVKDDGSFKKVFGPPGGTKILETLISDVLNEDVKVLEYKDKELPIIQVNDHQKRVDMLLNTNIGSVHLEMNSQTSPLIRRRNFGYFSNIFTLNFRENDMDEFKELRHTSINFTAGLSEKDPLIKKYTMFCQETKEDYNNGEFTLYEVNMDKAKKLCYNKVATSREKHIGALRMKREELEKFKGDDKFMEEVLEKMNEIYKKEAFPWTVEEENAMYDKYFTKLGEQNMLFKLLKNMIKSGMSSDDIVKATSVDKATVEQALKELNETVNV